MTEIQGKSILVRVSEGSNYRESNVFLSFSTVAFMPEVPAFNLHLG